jgi:hypothetical protein
VVVAVVNALLLGAVKATLARLANALVVNTLAITSAIAWALERLTGGSRKAWQATALTIKAVAVAVAVVRATSDLSSRSEVGGLSTTKDDDAGRVVKDR